MSEPPVSQTPPSVAQQPRTAWSQVGFGVHVVTAFASLFWLGEHVLLVASTTPSKPGFYLWGMATGLFLVLLIAGVAGLLVGLVWAVSIRDRGSLEVLRLGRDRLADWLAEGETDAHAERLARALAWLLPIAMAAVAMWFASRTTAIAVRRSANVAWVVASLGIAQFALVLLLRTFCYRLSAKAIGWVRRVPVLRAVVEHTWIAGLVTAGAGLTAIAVVGYVARATLASLPWRQVLLAWWAGNVALLIGVLMERPSRSRVLSVVRRVAWYVVVVGLGVVGYFSPAATGDLRIAVRKPYSSSGALDLVRRLTDLDGDGVISGFGDGDCAPLDPTRFRGAVEIAGNGVDENCDGKDLKVASYLAWGKADYAFKPRPSAQPPIVLITVDALAARHLQPWGAKRNAAPKLNAWFEKSVVFEHCFGQGPSTRLSMPALFTSRYDTEIRRKNQRRIPLTLVDKGNYTIAEYLRDAGYETRGVVSDVRLGNGRWRGIGQGFKSVDMSPIKQRGHNSPAVTDSALGIIREPRDAPLFLWVHYFDVHPPLTRAKNAPNYGPTQRDIYDGELHGMDAEIGRLLDAIESELKSEALVIFTADHGYGFDKPRHSLKGYGYDLNTITLHVPLAIHGKWFKPRSVETLVSLMDVFPTISNIVPGTRPHKFRGYSLIPEITGQGAPRPQMLYHLFYLAEKIRRNSEPLARVGVRSAEFNLELDRVDGVVQAWRWQDDYEERDNVWDSEGENTRALTQMKDLADSFAIEFSKKRKGSKMKSK